MDEELWKTLPDELVERIISRVPFPFIFKARCLSKSWLAKFRTIPGPSEKSKECHNAVASSFQKQVGERSGNWETFCPIILCDGECFGYNRSSQAWRKLPSLSFIPHIFLYSPELRMEGAFVYLFAPHRKPGREQVYVGNVLARTWRRLRQCPFTGRCVVRPKLVTMAPSSEAYKIILFCQEDKGDDVCSYAAIYNSRSDSWRRRDFSPSPDSWTPCFLFSEMVNSVCLDGVLYTICGPALWSCHVEEETLEESREIESFTYEDRSAIMVICQSKLWVLARSFRAERDVIQVYNVLYDESSGSPRMRSMAEGPPPDRGMKIDDDYSGDGYGFIYVGVDEDSGRVVAYNIETDGWCWVPGPAGRGDDCEYDWVGGSFQPGMGTFTEA